MVGRAAATAVGDAAIRTRPARNGTTESAKNRWERRERDMDTALRGVLDWHWAGLDSLLPRPAVVNERGSPYLAGAPVHGDRQREVEAGRRHRRQANHDVAVLIRRAA